MLSTWCSQQQQELTAAHPRGVDTFTGAVRATARLAGPIAFLVYLAAQAAGHSGDLAAFAAAGSQVTHGDWTVFDTSYLQVGPLLLLLVGLGADAAEGVGLAQWFGASVVLAGLCAVLSHVLIRLLLADRATGVRLAAASLGLTLSGSVAISASYGHLEEWLVILLLTLASAAAVRGRLLVPAALLAAAVTIKLWAVVGIVILLVAASTRVIAMRVLVLCGLTAAAYLPFVLQSKVATFDMVWRVESPAPLSLALPNGHPFGYRARAVQVLVAVCTGALVIWVRRGRPDIVWALPLALVGSRLVLDPLPSPYYWAALVALLVLSSLTAAACFVERALTASALAVAGELILTTAQDRWGAVLLALLGATAVAVAARPRQPMQA